MQEWVWTVLLFRFKDQLWGFDSSQHQHIGISKEDKTNKVHALVDALGYPVKILLSGGNVNDITVAPKLIANLNLKGSIVLADKAHASIKFIKQIKDCGGNPCITCLNSFVDRWKIDRIVFVLRVVITVLHRPRFKRRKIISPLGTNSDSLPAVSRVLRIIFIVTAQFHIVPNWIKSAFRILQIFSFNKFVIL